MPLPRNAIGKNMKYKKKYSQRLSQKTNKNKLNELYHQNSLVKLGFRKCKMIIDKEVNKVVFKEVYGNMKTGLLVINYTDLQKYESVTYDIYDIIKKKNEREENMRKIKYDESLDKHQKEKMQEEENNNKPTEKEIGLHNKMIDELNEKFSDDKFEFFKDLKIDDIISTDNEDRTQKREVNDNVKKNYSKNFNRHHKNFLKNVNNKFKLTENLDVEYFEVFSNTTPMIIENPVVKKLCLDNMEYLVVVGTIYLKRDFIKSIDKYYNAEENIEEYTDFYERMTENENPQVMDEEIETSE